MRVNNQVLATAVPLNADFNSVAHQLNQVYGYAIQAEWTGTPNGTFKLQASDDPNHLPNGDNPNGTFVPTNWTDIANSPVVVSAAGNYMWNVFDVMYTWVRLVYTDASGGTSTAVMTQAAINTKSP